MPSVLKVRPTAPSSHTTRGMLHTYKDALPALETTLDATFEALVAHLAKQTNKVILSGVGKSGYIAAKIASSFASTNTPALFLHPTDAAHGDLGLIQPFDTIIILSNSGETEELAPLLDYVKTNSLSLAAFTSQPDSTLAKAAHWPLHLPPAPEICSLGLAPTTSTFLMLALGDILMARVAEEKGLTQATYKGLHPGGALGFKLKQVGDIMRTGEALPCVHTDTLMSEAIVTMTEKQAGCLAVLGPENKLVGIISDGDLRRTMSPNLLKQRAQNIMTKNPVTIGPCMFLEEAIQLMAHKKIHVLFVTNDNQTLSGLITWQDCVSLAPSRTTTLLASPHEITTSGS